MANTVIKTSTQVKRDRTVRKVQKYISIAAVVMLMLMMSGISVFATGGAAASGQPSNVDTTTMGQFGNIVWWIVRIVILAVGAVPVLINLINGISNQDDRQRNVGLITLVITGAVFAATFALSGIIGF